MESLLDLHRFSLAESIICKKKKVSLMLLLHINSVFTVQDLRNHCYRVTCLANYM